MADIWTKVSNFLCYGHDVRDRTHNSKSDITSHYTTKIPHLNILQPDSEAFGDS